MKAYGGFFELELARNGRSYHTGALALCSGRACLGRILDEIHPASAYVPFYVCDTALEPFHARRIPVEFYAITRLLEPELAREPRETDIVMYVDYFGLKSAAASAMVRRYRGRAIIDDTQAFFQRGYDHAWSFNSARKFFGVPDGGYAYGPGLGAEDHPRLTDIRYEHLITRLLGDLDRGYAQYRESEASISGACLKMSELSERLLTGIDCAAVIQARQRNYRRLHERLGASNQLPADVLELRDQVPFCYPWLPGRPVTHEALWTRRLFVPVLWRDVQRRSDSGFEWERELATRVLALPVDQRYGDAEIDQMCDRIKEASG